MSLCCTSSCTWPTWWHDDHLRNVCSVPGRCACVTTALVQSDCSLRCFWKHLWVEGDLLPAEEVTYFPPASRCQLEKLHIVFQCYFDNKASCTHHLTQLFCKISIIAASLRHCFSAGFMYILDHPAQTTVTSLQPHTWVAEVGCRKEPNQICSLVGLELLYKWARTIILTGSTGIILATGDSEGYITGVSWPNRRTNSPHWVSLEHILMLKPV